MKQIRALSAVLFMILILAAIVAFIITVPIITVVGLCEIWPQIQSGVICTGVLGEIKP